MREILKETPVCCADIKENLEAIKKKEKELNFRAQKTEDYLQSMNLISSKKAQELYGKLDKVGVARLRDVHLVKLIDTMPTTDADVKVVLSGYAGLTVKKDELKKIADIIGEYAK